MYVCGAVTDLILQIARELKNLAEAEDVMMDIKLVNTKVTGEYARRSLCPAMEAILKAPDGSSIYVAGTKLSARRLLQLYKDGVNKIRPMNELTRDEEEACHKLEQAANSSKTHTEL